MSEESAEERESQGRDEAEEMARLQEQINNLPVSEHIMFMMQSLSSLVVDRLGLVPEGAGRRDLGQARLAIEAFKALLGALEETQSAEELAGHRSVLSQLQMAYVGAMDGVTPGTAPTQGETRADEAAEAEASPATSAKEEQPVEVREEPTEAATQKATPKKATPKKAAPTKAAKPRPDTKSDVSAGAAKGGAKGGAKASGGGKKSS